MNVNIFYYIGTTCESGLNLDHIYVLSCCVLDGYHSHVCQLNMKVLPTINKVISSLFNLHKNK